MNLKISGKHVPASITRLILVSSIKLNSKIEDNLKTVYKDSNKSLSHIYRRAYTYIYVLFYMCLSYHKLIFKLLIFL